MLHKKNLSRTKRHTKESDYVRFDIILLFIRIEFRRCVNINLVSCLIKISVPFHGTYETFSRIMKYIFLSDYDVYFAYFILFSITVIADKRRDK